MEIKTNEQIKADTKGLVTLGYGGFDEGGSDPFIRIIGDRVTDYRFTEIKIALNALIRVRELIQANSLERSGEYDETWWLITLTTL